MQSINFALSAKPLGWIQRESGFLIPFGLIPIESETTALGDSNEWKEVKVIPTISILNSSDSELVCPSDFCRKRLTKNHTFDNHIREHLGLHPIKSEALNTNRTKVQNSVPINYYCNHKGCIYSISEGERFFTKLKYLKQHYLKVHAPKTFVCKQCQKSFGTAVFLEIHSRMCGKVFICSCKASYATLEALQTHARRKSHDYDHAGYRNILKSVKHANPTGKPDEGATKEKPKDMQCKVPSHKPKQTLLFPKPNPVVGNLMTTPWVFDDFSCPTLKVDFGTQTVPMLFTSHNGKPVCDAQKYAKRKKSAQTQTSQVRVRISTETQTANVIKRRRSNRKKQLAEAETQCHSEESELPLPDSIFMNAENQTACKLKMEATLDPFLSSVSALKDTPTKIETNTKDSIFDDFSSFSDNVENYPSGTATLENMLNELEEVHSQTQTDPYVFHCGTYDSIFDDFNVNLNVGDTDVSEFLNFVTTETQTLPGIVISPSIMNASSSSSPTDTANTQTIDNVGYLTETYGCSSSDIPPVFEELALCSSFTTTDALSATANYLETMDNETQTQCYDFSSLITKMFGPESY